MEAMLYRSGKAWLKKDSTQSSEHTGWLSHRSIQGDPVIVVYRVTQSSEYTGWPSHRSIQSDSVVGVYRVTHSGWSFNRETLIIVAMVRLHIYYIFILITYLLCIQIYPVKAIIAVKWFKQQFLPSRGK
jgi:hypothetical protein